MCNDLTNEDERLQEGKYRLLQPGTGIRLDFRRVDEIPWRVVLTSRGKEIIVAPFSMCDVQRILMATLMFMQAAIDNDDEDN